MKKLALAVLSVACFAAGSAIADENQYAISYSNQELSNHEGVAAVHQRIMRTAKQHCPSYSQVRDLRRVRSCVSEVADDLVTKIAHPQLSSYHSGDSDVRVATMTQGASDNS